MKVVYNKIIPFPGFLAINIFGICFVREECKDKISEKRMLNFQGVNCGGWLKYIRLYRNPKNKKMFVVCNRDSEPILWKSCTEENLDKENLCVH